MVTTVATEIQFHIGFLLFRVMETHRVCEVTATPWEQIKFQREGANLSELIEQ